MKEKEHQSKLSPSDNKFHKGNGSDLKHYWLTPPSLWDKLRQKAKRLFGKEIHDGCPYPFDPEQWDGLVNEYPTDKVTYLNIPFGSIIHEGKKKGATAWARKMIREQERGATTMMAFPIDKWVLMLLEAGARVENLGDVRWLATEDGSEGKGTGRHIALFTLEGKITQETKYTCECDPRWGYVCEKCSMNANY